jgi:hypothetical protein
MTNVVTYSYSHSVTYVADNILKSLKDIIRLSGLDPSQFVASYADYTRALEAWLNSGDLEMVILEIYNPNTNALIIRWDIEVVYSWSGGSGSFWTDTEQLRYAIKKVGINPIEAKYTLLLKHKPGAPDVSGWGPSSYRSTAGMLRQSLGSTVEHSGLGASTSYWRKN